jgi:alpha-1,6-mannosyltransferase
VNVPALIGVVYIGWDWMGGEVSWRQRIGTLVKAGIVSAAVLGIVSEIASLATGVSLGFGWVSALSNPGTVRSWMDPATGLADLISHIASVLGFGRHSHVIITILRGAGGLVAIAISVRLLLAARGGVSSLRAIGLSMLAVVLLGPVVQPWYLVWGILLLSPLAVGRTRQIVVGLSIVASFLGLPGGRALLGQISHTNPLVVALFCALLAGVGAIPLVPRVRRLLRSPEEPALISQS